MYNSIWYENLVKPPFASPDWVFFPVWIILYITIFVSLVLYTVKPAYDKTLGYIFFCIQMLLNIIWSPAFFVLKNPLLALFIVILLNISIILTIYRFYKVSKTAAIIMIPYLLWTLFATYLNFGYLVLN